MRIFESLDISERFANPVLTIGNYDGVHVGHRMIIEKVKREGWPPGGTSMLMTFNPHPLAVVKPEALIGLISPTGLKKRLIEETRDRRTYRGALYRGVPAHRARRLREGYSRWRLGIKGLIVGYDFRFGKQGKGDVIFSRSYPNDRVSFLRSWTRSLSTEKR